MGVPLKSGTGLESLCGCCCSVRQWVQVAAQITTVGTEAAAAALAKDVFVNQSVCAACMGLFCLMAPC